ncbi:MAG: RNA polymerase sigma factor [Bryobacterales bacterium]|nr:RNA polymerase sigma factor [Bryobacterales bacterium]
MSDSTAAIVQAWPRSQETTHAEPASARQAATEYLCHSASVRRYAYAIVRNPSEAEDIAQECFVRMMQTLNRGVAVERPLPWLLRVAHNLALDSLARRPRELALEDSAVFSMVDPAPSPEAAFVEQNRRAQVQHALCQLSAQELRCWTLRAEGLRYREIAEILAVQTGTVATFLVRAAEKLSSI